MENKSYDYLRKVNYYETDKMGITHHSNYIRWMEEARVDYLDQIGWSYKRLEDEGLLSAVTAIDCRYKASTTFAEEIRIAVAVRELRGAVLKLSYTMTNGEGKTVFEGRSEHCFLNRDNRLVRLKRDAPALYERLESLIETE